MGVYTLKTLKNFPPYPNFFLNSIELRRKMVYNITVGEYPPYQSRQMKGWICIMSDLSKTIRFSIGNDSERQMKEILATVYEALSEKGYNPLNQIVGYILSEDPTYITNYKNARSLICKLDRDELMSALVRNYLGI